MSVWNPQGSIGFLIFNYLEKNIDVCLTHPKYVKAIKGKKTDKKDSKWIADLYKFDLVRCSFIPPKDFRSGLGNSLSPNFRSFFMFFFFAFLHIPENIFVKFSKKY